MYCYVDADDQGTATDFAALRNQQGETLVSYTSIQLAGKAVREQVLKLKDKFNCIIIDTGMIKAPAIIIICCIAIIQVIAAVFLGGQDKRAVFSTVLTLLMIAAILFSLDRLILWMADFFGR